MNPTNNRILFILRHSIAILVPIALMWTLYHSVLQAWWLADDPALLQAIAEHGIISHFYQSEVWRSLIAANLTPWLILSLGIDWHFFGLEPSGFYLHHLLSFSIVLLIAYFVLNLFFSPLVCSLTLSIFVVSIPSANIAQFLMTRHYLEGLGLSLIAVLLYVKAIETHRLRWAIFGSIFYLLATTAKEIYVPLVVILPWLPVANWVQRWKMLIPFVVVAGSYVLWRAYMLKSAYILSGYNSLSPKLDWNTMLALPNRVAEVLGWQHSWQLLILLLASLVFLGIILKIRQPYQIISILLWLAVTLLPIIPVLSILDSRYLFLPYFVFCISMGFSLQWFINKRWNYFTLGLGFCLLMLGVKSLESGTNMIRQTEMLNQSRTEGQFILTANNYDSILLNPLNADWFYSSLQWIREHILKLPKGAKFCYDLCVCQPQATDNIYKYQQGKLIYFHVDQQMQTCGKPEAKLNLNLQYALGALHWQLAPYQQGQYYVTITKWKNVTGQFVAIPAQGSYPLMLSKKLLLVIKYVSPEGWHTYSPMLVLDPTKKDAEGLIKLTWQRQ